MGTGHQPGQSGSARAIWLLRAALLALPVLSLAVLWVVSWAYAPPPARTGDALLDALFQDFDRRGALPWESTELTLRNHNYSQTMLAEMQIFASDHSPARRYPRDTVLGHLDEQLTADPRYWLLLCRSGHFMPDAAYAAASRQDLWPRQWFLEEARRRGVADVAILIALLDALDDPWADAATKASALPQGKNQNRWPDEAWAKREQAYRAASAGQLDPLLDELLAIGKDDAAAYYVAARYETERGNRQRAAQLLAQGNSLTRCSSFTTLDPATFWHTSAPPPQTWAVEDMALGNYFARAMPNYIRWKDMARKLALDAVQAGDRAGLQEVHTFSCRFARNGQPSVIGHLVGNVMCALPGSALQDKSPRPLSGAELHGLGQLHTARGQITAQCKTRSSAIAFPSRQRFSLELLESLLSRGDTSVIAWLKLTHQTEREEVEFCHQQLDPLWDQLAAFDYTQLDFPSAVAPAATAESPSG